MTFLRTFEGPNSFDTWFNKNPNLQQLLKCFDRNVVNLEPVSVHESFTALEEVECVAAHYETFNRSSLKKQFAVRVCLEDCRKAQIEVRHDANQGTTGVKFVDRRHYNLIGTQEQFANLVKEIVRGIWEGEDRVRAFPETQLHAQLSVFREMPSDLVEDEAKERCQKSLSGTGQQQNLSPDGRYVEIDGWLNDEQGQSVRIKATRRISEQRYYAWRSFMYVLKGLWRRGRD